VTTRHRSLLALAALVVLLLALAGAVAIAVTEFPRGLLAIAFVAIAVPLAWWGVVRRGIRRGVALAVAALLLVAALALLIVVGPVLAEIAVVLAAALGVALARAAFVVHAELPSAPRPTKPVLFWNPRSGGGKAEHAHLPDEARARGIEPVELLPGEDLRDLVRAAIEDGADALAMAGGDGSQAIVAAMAAEAGLPYACIPAGTRNHFALDLGVDRDDVVGALDALVDGRERRVDLAEVNGRVFVNNVSLGVYAEAVQREGYRDAKLRTISQTIPATLGPGGTGLDLRWTGPDGHEHASGAVILVSNNPYRLRAIGAGTRPRLDDGELGVAVFEDAEQRNGEGDGGHGPFRQWATPDFEVRSAQPVPGGVDGEAVVLEAPLHFTSRPGVLTVRIAPRHPGSSPSADLPDSPVAAAARLVHLAAGRPA
jgi:diacylglycerol kinase family enzyme